MKVLKKLSILLALCMAAVLVLAACGPKGGGTTPTQKDEPQTEEVTTKEAEPENGAVVPEEDEMPEVHGSEPRPKIELSADLKNFENRLETFFGTKVALNPSAKDQTKGTIVINYYSMDDLTRIQEIMDNR